MDTSPPSIEFPTPSSQKQVKITEVEIVDENTALNVIVGFLEIANKKGSFSFEEGAKIWECIKKFKQPSK